VTRVLIRVDGELSDELLGAFPGLRAMTPRTQTTLTGEMADQQEMQGVLNYLSSLGVPVIEVLTVPD
jgi:hypothetical protein